MSLKTIRLELARDTDFPEGSNKHGYEFTVPLDAEDHIDVDEWHKYRENCRVRRFWGDEAEEVGHVIHTQGRRWAFHYDISGNPDSDEPGYKFDSHAFRQGEYVSLTEQDGSLRTFVVAAIRPVHGVKPK